MRVLRIALLVLAGILVLLQLVPVERTNPAVEAEVAAPAHVKAVLRKACYDCHSNETAWPWYSRIAPFSFLVANHVEEGRRELNFSRWNVPGVKAVRPEELAEEVEKGAMPLASYELLHAEARLTQEERATVVNWARSIGAGTADGHARSARREERHDGDGGGEASER